MIEQSYYDQLKAKSFNEWCRRNNVGKFADGKNLHQIIPTNLPSKHSSNILTRIINKLINKTKTK